MKKCKGCGLEKDLSCFQNQAKNRGGGPVSRCRECYKKYKRSYYQKNREKILLRASERMKRNPHLRWSVKYPEKHKAACKRRYEQDKKTHALWSARYRKTFEGWITGTLTKLRSNCRERGHAPPCFRNRNELRDWVKSQKNFEEIWNNWVSSGHETWKHPSIDRLDNSRGYEIDNIRLTTWRENAAAFTKSQEHRERQRIRFKEMWKKIKESGVIA